MSQPRDPAIDAILTAETLLEHFRGLLPSLTSLMPGEVTEATGQAQHLYPEIWAQIDSARSLLAARGTSMAELDEVRARQPASMLGVERVDTRDPNTMIVASVVVGAGLASLGAKQSQANREGLADAHRAIELLRAALPDVAWSGLRDAAKREVAGHLDELGRGRTKKLLVGALGLAIVGALGFGLVKLLEKPKELTTVEQAESDIAELEGRLATNPCDASAAEELVSTLRRWSKPRRAREVGHEFLRACGDNEAIRKKVGAPK